MEGGIGIALLLIIAVVVVGFAIALYVTGGGLWARDTSTRKRRGGGETEERPDHKSPTTPAHEHTELVGSDRKD